MSSLVRRVSEVYFQYPHYAYIINNSFPMLYYWQKYTITIFSMLYHMNAILPHVRHTTDRFSWPTFFCVGILLFPFYRPEMQDYTMLQLARSDVMQMTSLCMNEIGIILPTFYTLFVAYSSVSSNTTDNNKTSYLLIGQQNLVSNLIVNKCMDSKL